jgi:hypothetical protein
MSIVSVAEILRHAEKLKEVVADYIVELKRDGAYIKSKDGTVTIVPYAEINDWLQTVRDKVIVIYSYLTSDDIEAIAEQLGLDYRRFRLRLTRNTYIVYGGMLPRVDITEDYTNFLCFGFVRCVYNIAYDLSHTNIFVTHADIIDIYGATVGTLIVGLCEELYLIDVIVGYLYAFVTYDCLMDGVSTIGVLGSRSWVISCAMEYLFNNVFDINVLMVSEWPSGTNEAGYLDSMLAVFSDGWCYMWNAVDVFSCGGTGAMCGRALDLSVEVISDTEYRVVGPANKGIRVREKSYFYCIPPEA